MSSTQRFRYAGVSAYLSGTAVLLSLVSLFLFDTVGEPWGVVYGIAILFQLVFMLPFVFVLRSRFGSESCGLKLLSERLGLFLIVFITIAQALVVLGAFGPRDFGRTLDMSMTISTVIATWLVLSNYLGQGTWTLDRNLAWFATLAVVGYLLTIIVFRNGGQASPLIFVSLLASSIGFAVWSILLGRLLLSGKLSG